jgi:hypothetical protein
MTVWKKFTLPDDEYEYIMSNQSKDLHCMLYDFDQHMRSELKYNDNLTDDQDEYLYKLRTYFYELLDQYNINMDI